MFKENPKLVQEIKRLFILILISVSLIGFLCSNEEFSFNETYLREQMTCCSRGFMLFLRIVMNKMTSQMVDNLFWAKKLREIIQHKQRVQDSKFPKGKEKSIVSAYTAAPQLTEINNTCERSFNFLFAEIEQIRLGKSHTVVQDLSRFDHEIFTTIQEAL